MKVVLAALNSKFIHSNLAVRYLKEYTKDLNYDCVIKEFSVNDRKEKVLEELICEKPDILAFSCYIWNIEYIEALAKLVNLVKPNIKILYGGPEVTYDSVNFLNKNIGNYVIYGEGEETYYQFIEYNLKYIYNTNDRVTKNGDSDHSREYLSIFKNIKGLCFKINSDVIINEPRELMDMNKIVFPYCENDDFKNKIIYYEASRGCPFSCKYCLSSTIQGVRFLNLERVKNELAFLVNKGIKLIKFVDRTFNCNEKYAMEVWKFIIGMDTETTFHFEISADILTESEIELLAKAPKGRIQFEVGVQTTNNEVLKNINRPIRFEDIKEKVEKVAVNKNIKQHLDLIAGLPGEDFISFKNSFNDVYSIHPEEVQMGFLKILKGSLMEQEASKWEIIYSPYVPYEILKNKYISYEELLKLKRVEEVVDKYYNSGSFSNILNYLLPKFETAFDFYYELGMFFYDKGYLNRNISSADYYKVFIEFVEEKLNGNSEVLKEIIKYDFLKCNRKKWIPKFLNRDKNKIEEKELKEKVIKGDFDVSRNIHIEKFFVDIKQFMQTGNIKKGDFYIIFDEDNKKEIFV
jgi:radical SAM superfamily enzyme YgiQ (UPF0313 family)